MTSLPYIEGMSGNSVERPQWESGNASTRFPFADDTVIDGYPFDAVVDACVVVPSELAPASERVYVGCLHISRHMVSVMVYSGRRPILACSATRQSMEPFSPVRMEPVDKTCSGFISFGDIRFDDFSTPVTRREAAYLSESAVVRPVVGRLRRFVQPGRNEEAKGIVGIIVPDGVGMSLHEDGDSSLVSFTMSDDARDSVTIWCDPTKPSPGSPYPVKSINGVHPDSLGRIAIVFARDASEVPK